MDIEDKIQELETCFYEMYKVLEKTLGVIKYGDCISNEDFCEDSREHNEYKKNNTRLNLGPNFSFSSFCLSRMFFNGIKKNIPETKKPNLDLWSLEIEKMHQIDGYSYEQIRDLIWFAITDGFWSTLCLCPKTLRNNAEKLLPRIK